MPKPRISAVIVDDEPDALNFLSDLLDDTNEIEICAKAEKVEQGVKAIVEHKPDLVFLDIDMPNKNGFELVNEINELKVETKIIFTTAYRQYAVDAFDKAAFGYLMKPIRPDKLQKLINRFKLEKQQNNTGNNKHKFRTFKGFVMIDQNEVMGCKADGNYTHVFFNNGKAEHVICQIGEIEQKFGSESFFRSHRSALVNIKYIHSFARKTSTLQMLSEIVELEFPVAREKVRELERLI
ncbi:MAG: response regulator transcription factor [Bacteroidales bacterium]|nr:response regulator transcription factor [Bacteroidales bacterium]MCF8343788.1 response regulator transcription factor [Bacteroidales bacterium]MCF8350288.1 response regulator transcription factor [Bacteroidales bacterium]MCF8374727.1 response regulator transcription factor [Bacteroidales bacterium]MCF8399869.1 response regulator transcription factor [Bacteroidales bacterium]